MVSNYKLLSIDNTYNSRGLTTKSYPEAAIQSLLYPSLLIYIPLPISPLTTFLLSHDERVCLTCAEQRRVAHSRGGCTVWGWCTSWGGHRRRCGQQLFFSSPARVSAFLFCTHSLRARQHGYGYMYRYPTDTLIHHFLK
jgi:hypothetical protein